MTRRTHLKLLTAVTAAGSITTAAAKDNPAMFQQILEASLKEKKGVMLYVKGQSIPGVVTAINPDNVELRSREYSKIVVRLESIDAAALS
jgi:endonuclease YncB( thermonuclease family)